MELHKRAAVEAGIDGEARAAFGRLVQLCHRLVDHEHEEVWQLNGGRYLEPLSERRLGVVAAGSNRQVEVLGRPGLAEPKFHRVAALQHPSISAAVGRREHAREQAVERHLPPQALQVDEITLCAVEESRFQCGPQGAGCCVLAWGGHRAPASGYG